MKLFTRETEKFLQSNYHLGSSLNQTIYLKIFNPYGRGAWYIMNQDPNDTDYLWGIVKLHEIEMGSFSKNDLVTIRLTKYNLPLIRDQFFEPIKASEVYNRLRRGEIV